MNKRVCALFFLLCLSFGVLFVKMAELCGGNVSGCRRVKKYRRRDGGFVKGQHLRL